MIAAAHVVRVTRDDRTRQLWVAATPLAKRLTGFSRPSLKAGVPDCRKMISRSVKTLLLISPHAGRVMGEKKKAGRPGRKPPAAQRSSFFLEEAAREWLDRHQDGKK
jgi:hypothetical protein